MYIEFSLPKDAAGQAALYVNQILTRELNRWSKQHGIDYKSKNIKYFKRITFDDESHYAFFAMTWNPDRRYYALGRWRIVSDLNNKTSFDDVV